MSIEDFGDHITSFSNFTSRWDWIKCAALVRWWDKTPGSGGLRQEHGTVAQCLGRVGRCCHHEAGNVLCWLIPIICRRTKRRISVEKLPQHFEALWNKAESWFMWKHVFSLNEKTAFIIINLSSSSPDSLSSSDVGKWGYRNIYLKNPCKCITYTSYSLYRQK